MGLSLDIFKETVQFFDDLNEGKKENINNNYNLAKLYSISYIKAYLAQLVNFSLNQRYKLSSICDIIEFINENNNPFRKVLKLYIVKLIFYSKEINQNIGNITQETVKIFDCTESKNIILEIFDKENEEYEIFKEIIKEKNSLKNGKYYKYPYLEYFTYTIDKQYELEIFKEQIKSEKDYMNKYPILFKFLDVTQGKDKNHSVLRFVEKYNEFCNLMIDTYTFRITREQAKKIKLKDSKIYKQAEDKCKEFIYYWNKYIKEYATKNK